jgi:predicted protein tyrosine phosphatase
LQPKRFLFVCGKNQLRSPTAEQIFSGRDGLEVLSAGTRKDADEPMSDELVEWADTIFVMERRHRKQVQSQFQRVLGDRKIVVLDTPDDYPFMDEKLIGLLKQKMQRHLP